MFSFMCEHMGAGRQHMEEAERLGLRVDQIAEFNCQLKVGHVKMLPHVCIFYI